MNVDRVRAESQDAGHIAILNVYIHPCQIAQSSRPVDRGDGVYQMTRSESAAPRFPWFLRARAPGAVGADQDGGEEAGLVAAVVPGVPRTALHDAVPGLEQHLALLLLQ